MNNKTAGIVVIVIAALMSIILASFTLQINKNIHSQCIDEQGICPHAGSYPVESYIGFSILLILGIFGVYLIATNKNIEKLKLQESEKIQATISYLEGDEKNVYEKVVEANGTIFQSELMEKSGFNKVKISRILDRLEGKGLIEKRRRGMTNVVVIRHK